MPHSPLKSRCPVRALGGAAAALVLVVALTGCGGDNETPDASGPALEVEVHGDEVKPVAERVDLALGERLTITVTADRAGELHVHSDPEHTFDFGPGTTTFGLTIDTPGSVDIEEHESDALVARLLVR